MLGKIEGRRKRGRQRMRWLDSITDSKDTSLSKLWEIMKEHGSLACCSPWGHKELDVTERLNNNNLSYTHDIRQGHKNLWWNAQRNMKFS